MRGLFQSKMDNRTQAILILISVLVANITSQTQLSEKVAFVPYQGFRLPLRQPAPTTTTTPAPTQSPKIPNVLNAYLGLFVSENEAKLEDEDTFGRDLPVIRNINELYTKSVELRSYGKGPKGFHPALGNNIINRMRNMTSRGMVQFGVPGNLVRGGDPYLGYQNQGLVSGNNNFPQGGRNSIKTPSYGVRSGASGGAVSIATNLIPYSPYGINNDGDACCPTIRSRYQPMDTVENIHGEKFVPVQLVALGKYQTFAVAECDHNAVKMCPGQCVTTTSVFSILVFCLKHNSCYNHNTGSVTFTFEKFRLPTGCVCKMWSRQ
ncbi:uncharacterized protein LOC106168987 isoform X1 [Lingula anatina]|uniref:Uncharacterized protein LOC106168987 isoform X1 n=1 Tax=Lingula anatina TaxID=7574 RepID=A0A1S3J1L9_LINAN|nr:uncharacterized protein LOC106168987 isoform X1 [Lingula anatina]|eukprot:XP_013403719.1 uncharacterized protein LOC106168987 isoform X1 [Lingula anatina]